MKIRQLLSGLRIAVTNEEQQFISMHADHVLISALDEHAQVVAQNLVRKGIYDISKDNHTLIKNLDETKS